VPTAHSDNCLRPEHANHVSNKPETPATRRDRIGRRIDAIGTRIEELEEQRQAGPSRSASSDRLAAAQRHAARSQAAAEQAITSSINAFRRAAEAHDILAAAYERLAAAGGDDAELHQQQTARHRAAASADRHRAERAQSILSTD
jgi:hypothetical protein